MKETEHCSKRYGPNFIYVLSLFLSLSPLEEETH